MLDRNGVELKAGDHVWYVDTYYHGVIIEIEHDVDMRNVGYRVDVAGLRLFDCLAETSATCRPDSLEKLPDDEHEREMKLMVLKLES